MPGKIIENIELFEQEIDVALYLRILNKRKKLIILVTVALVLLAALYSFTARPTYRAETKILIQKKIPKINSYRDVVGGQTPSYNSDLYDLEFIQTQISVLKSSALADRVVEAINFSDRVKLSKDQDATEMLLAMVKLENVRRTYVVKLSVESWNPVLSADIANCYAQEYIKFVLKEKSAVSEKALEMLQQRKEELREKLEKSELELQSYRAKNQILSSDEQQENQVKRISELSASLTEARAKKLELEALYNQYQNLINSGVNLEELPLTKNNPSIQELRSDYFKKEAIYTENLQKFTEDHPIMVQLKTELENLKERIRQQIIKAVEGIKSEYQTSASREEGLIKAIEEQKKLSWDINEKTVKLEDLQREVNSNRELYTDLVQKMKEVDLGSDFLISSITVLDKADVPTKPVRPQKLRNLILSLFLGIFGGVALALSLERIDLSIKTSDDVEKYLGLPFLGFIPSLRIGEGAPENRLIIYSDSKSNASEALRSIRTSIFFAHPNIVNMLITSSLPQEGKSFCAVNIAIAMANANKKVLLVDCDMRRPTLHKVLDTDNEIGITDYLSNSAKFDQVLQNTIVENLSVVTCGKIPENPAELIGSEEMARFIQEAKDNSYFLVIDSPPLLSVADSIILSSLVEGVAYVIRSGKTTCEMAKEAKKKLLAAKAKILGVVLNRQNIHNEDYYYQYYNYKQDGGVNAKNVQLSHKHKKSQSLSDDAGFI